MIDYSAAAALPAMLTQSDVIRYAARHPNSLRALSLDASIEHAGLLSDKQSLVAVSQQETALDAFAVMREKQLTCVPVVDQ